MKHKPSWKKVAHSAVSLSLLFGLLVPTTAFADDKDKGKPQPAASQPAKQEEKKDPPKPAAQTSTQTQAPAPKNEDKKEDPKPAASSETKSAVQTDDRKADQAAAKAVEKPQGHSLSNPDGGGLDKPYDVGGKDANSQLKPSETSLVSDGNNGCGQDKKIEPREGDFGQPHIGYDDNQGWCGKQPENVKPPKADEGVAGITSVPVSGCYEWKDSGFRFAIDKTMSEAEARDFKRDTHFISDSMEGCKTPEKQNETKPDKLVHIIGCYKSGNDFKFVNDHLSEDDAKKFEDTHTEVEKKLCEEVKGAEDKTPNPPAPNLPQGDANVKIYLCHRTGSATNPWVLLHVSVNAQGHLRTDSHEPLDLHPQDIVFGETLPVNFSMEKDCPAPVAPVNPVGENKTESFPLSGCFYNPVTKEYIYFDAQTFSTKAAVDAKVQGLVAQSMNKADCKPAPGAPQPTPPPPGQTLGSRDDNPNPGPTKTEPVGLYGCFLKSDGSYVHENRTFSSQAELDAYKSSQGYVGIDAGRPNPDQCRNPERSNNPSDDRPNNPSEERRNNPPAEVAGIQSEGPAPTIFTSIAVTELGSTPPSRVITTAEVRQEMPLVDVPARSEGVRALIDESPAPAAPQAVAPQQPAPPRPATSLLPTTGEPLVDMALITLAFLGLALIGLRFVQVGTRRA